MNQKKNQPHQKNRRQIAAQRYQKLQREGRAFRKNSVISGSQSSGVTSAAEETGQLKSSRVMLREYREYRQKLYGGIAVVSKALLVVLFNFLGLCRRGYWWQILQKANNLSRS